MLLDAYVLLEAAVDEELGVAAADEPEETDELAAVDELLCVADELDPWPEA